MSGYAFGILLALAAAMLNASIGIFSKHLFAADLSPAGVSFYKCLIAFSMISLLAMIRPEIRRTIRGLSRDWKKIMVCSFLGIFVLYFFETSAYQYDLVPVVVFILLGSSAVATFVFSTLLLGEKKAWRQYVGFALALIGLAVMFIIGNRYAFSIGTLFAAVAGVGYGLFLVTTKKFELSGDLGLVWYLMGFGTLYLFVPFAAEGVTLPSAGSLPMLLALAILPTIGGFYCTTKALNYLQSSKVQLFELTEPVFATVFAFLFLSEVIRGAEWIGCVLILLAIFISEQGGSEAADVAETNERPLGLDG